MTHLSARNFVSYRAVIVRPHGPRLLVLDTTHGVRFPRLSISSSDRATKAITEVLRRCYGCSCVAVGYLSAKDQDFVILEELENSSSKNLKAITLDRLSCDQFPEEARIAVQRALGGPRSTSEPFSHFGWIYEAIDWVERTTGRRIANAREIRHVNANQGFALLEFPMEDGRSVWMKAVDTPNRHELKVTSLLADVPPLGGDRYGYVPQVLGRHPHWNAWLTAGGGEALTTPPNAFANSPDALGSAVTSLARLQIGTRSRISDLLTAGAFNQCWETIRLEAAHVFALIEEIMPLQRSAKAPILSALEVRRLHSKFLHVCDIAQSTKVPASILHGDMNPGNVLAGEQCQLIDWAEAYVGCPVVTLEHLLAWNRIADPSERQSVYNSLRQLYRNEWVRWGGCEAEDVKHLMRVGACLAAFSTLYGRGAWLHSDEQGLEFRGSFTRTVARVLNRAIHSLEEEERICL